MFKRITAFIFVLSFFCSSVLAEQVGYLDVQVDKWYYDDVMQATRDGTLEGRTESCFCPDANLKVSEAITIISKLHARIEKNQIFLNSDSKWYSSYVFYAISNGIIEENQFRNFEQYITRLDFASICYNLLKDKSLIINSVEMIPDLNKTNEHYEKLEMLYNLGIIIGIDDSGSFNPNGYISRAQMIVVINRIVYPERRVKKVFESAEDIRYNLFKEKVQNDICVSNEIFVSCDNWSVSQDNMDKLQYEINKFDGLCGFYLVTLDGKFRIGYNIDERISAASTVKAPFSLYSMKEIESGNGRLDEKCIYEAKHYCGGSGVIQNSVLGTEYSLSDVLYYTINVSDNTGYYMLQDRFGISGYNEFLDEIGCSRMKLDGGLRWGYVYPREAALIWNEIYNYSKESEYGKNLFELFTAAKYNFIMQAYLTKYETLYYKIAHKSGFNPNGRHDEAIVLIEDVPYFIVITTKPKANGSEKDFFNNIALILECIMQEYAHTTC